MSTPTPSYTFKRDANILVSAQATNPDGSAGEVIFHNSPDSHALEPKFAAFVLWLFKHHREDFKYVFAPLGNEKEFSILTGADEIISYHWARYSGDRQQIAGPNNTQIGRNGYDCGMGQSGICSICLAHGELTFEHVPPRRVFNDRAAVAHTLYGLEIGAKFKKSPLLLRRPAGLGLQTICERCNGLTASLYGDAFAEWTTQCLRYANRITTSNEMLLPFSVQPLNVLKQVATMILAVSGSTLSHEKVNAIRSFVLSPQTMSLPNDIVFAAYLNPEDQTRNDCPASTQNRLCKSCAVLDTRSGLSVFVFGEVAFPPMGYVAYIENRGKPISGDFSTLLDLRRFRNSYYGKRHDLFLQVPVRRPYGPVPGYYPAYKAGQKNVNLDDYHVLLLTNEARPNI